jgi:hypothetical protein
MKLIAICALATALAGCGLAREAETKKQLAQATAQLEAAREDCRTRSFKNRTERARCQNEAEERYMLPLFPHPDLARVKMALRLSLAAKVDQGLLSAEDAELEFAKANTQLVAELERRWNTRRLVAAQEENAAAASRAASGFSCTRFGNTVNCF